jgi:hypothetical protein
MCNSSSARPAGASCVGSLAAYATYFLVRDQTRFNVEVSTRSFRRCATRGGQGAGTGLRLEQNRMGDLDGRHIGWRHDHLHAHRRRVEQACGEVEGQPDTAMRGRTPWQGAAKRMAAWTAERTTAEALQELESARVPAGPLYSPQQALEDAHIRARYRLSGAATPRAACSDPSRSIRDSGALPAAGAHARRAHRRDSRRAGLLWR